MGYMKFSCLCSPLGLLWYHDLYLSLLSILSLFFCMVSWWLSSILLHVAVQISQQHLLKRLFLHHFMLLPFCGILIDHRDMGLFLGSFFCSIDVCVCSYASTRLFWLQWPCSTVWYQALWSLQLCSSFSRLLKLFGVVLVPCRFLQYLF